MLHLWSADIFRYQIPCKKGRHETSSHISLTGLFLLLESFFHYHWNQWFFLKILLLLTNRPWASFKSRVFQESSHFLAASSAWACRTPHADHYSKSVCCLSTVGTTAAKLGMVLSPLSSVYEFDSKDALCFWLIHFTYSLLLAFMTTFFCKERWMLPLIGIIYSGIIGLSQ